MLIVDFQEVLKVYGIPIYSDLPTNSKLSKNHLDHFDAVLYVQDHDFKTLMLHFKTLDAPSRKAYALFIHMNNDFSYGFFTGCVNGVL